ncbi:MAG: galactose-1-phosphate uridylyltransferase [Planctomycetota bacterium]
MTGTWEERWHPLRREWVIVAAHRQDRPWLGEIREERPRDVPPYDPNCTFCPGNRRIGGQVNPRYESVHVFDNDSPCVGPGAPRALEPVSGIHRNRPAEGVARVVCFTPRHDLSLSALPVDRVDSVLACWQRQYRELGARPEVAHVLIFENRGEAVGVSNPHPHGQIYATNFVFRTIEVEVEACREYAESRGSALWEDLVRAEIEDGRRILRVAPHSISFLPYFARYAYETYVGPLRAVPSIADLSDQERICLARTLRGALIRMDRLWRRPFPYVMALHQAPADGREHQGFGFHIEIHPPMRKPGLLKYLAGPEIGGGGFLADTAPEEKAAELRAVSWTEEDDSP